MPTFFARRYMRKIDDVGRTEKVLGVVILLLIAGIVAAFVIQVATNRDYLFEVVREETQREGVPPSVRVGNGLVRGESHETPSVPHPQRGWGTPAPFSVPSLTGWVAPKRVDRFTADDLYVKINGRAEVYLRFHVVGLAFGTYEHVSDADRSVDVYWYDMGEPANALGMYAEEEAPGGAPISQGAPPSLRVGDGPVSIGDRGYQVGGAVFFCKGSSYVQVIPTGLDESDARAALAIAERLAERIEGGDDSTE